MAAKVYINGRLSVHQGSGLRVISLDVCLTGPQHLPIPYCNCAQAKHAQRGASWVRVNHHALCHADSYFAISHGDEFGTHGGIHSHTTRGKAEFISHSPNVFIEGHPAVRQFDWMVSNNRNTLPALLI